MLNLPQRLVFRMKKVFQVSSKSRYQLIDITPKVEQLIATSGVEEGLCLVFVPHLTAAIVLTENEKGLKKDWLAVLKKLISGFDFLHNRIDDNADSHILSGLLGQGKTLPVEGGKAGIGKRPQTRLIELGFSDKM